MFLLFVNKIQFGPEPNFHRVTLVEETPSPDAAGPSRVKRKSFDLDNHDAFWQRHKGAPFPEVAENIQTELNDYRSKADDIERMKQDMGLGGGGGKAVNLGRGGNNHKFDITSLKAVRRRWRR